MKKIILAAALAISAVAAGPVAQAGGVNVGISIGVPGVVLGAPAYYAPPPPRYYRPRPVVVVPQPVYVGPRHGWRGRGHYERRVSDRGGKRWDSRRDYRRGHHR